MYMYCWLRVLSIINRIFLTSSCECCTVSSQNGVSSLMLASQNGHVEVVDKLLQHGATVDQKENVKSQCTYKEK